MRKATRRSDEPDAVPSEGQRAHAGAADYRAQCSALALTLLLWLLAPVAGGSTIITVGNEASVDLTDQLEWCAAPRETTLDGLLMQGCALQPLGPDRRSMGYRDTAIWLHLVLRNPSPQPLERLLEVGQPRMQRISLYSRSDGDWLLRERGLAVPVAERAPVSRLHDALPLVLPANTETELWLRLESALTVSAQTRLWTPEAFLIRAHRHALWTSMGLGSIVTLLLLGLLFLALTRDLTYGFFALMMTGHLLNFGQLSGDLQSHFWPVHLGFPSNLIPLAPLLSLVGLWGLVMWFLQSSQRSSVFGITHALFAITSCVVLYGILIDLKAVLPLIDALVAITGLLLFLLTWQATRAGVHAASLLFLAFCVPILLVGLRLGIVNGWIGWSPWIATLGPWALTAGSPLILIGLIVRSRKLQSELVEAQAESAAQLDFLARMSHELRSPLDVILGQVQWLARTHPDTARGGGIQTIRESGRHLLRVIDDILDYAKGTAGMLTVRPEPLALRHYLRGVERMGRLSAEARKNRFELILTVLPPLEPTLHLLLDPDRLHQVLANLLSNASRHTEQGLITLDVRLSPLGDERARIEFRIVDTGEGIQEQDIARIFLPFERAGSRSDGRRQGAGLGLAIGRQLVQLMGGTLSVSSEPGKGSRFGFTLHVPVIPDSEISDDNALDGFDAAGYAGRVRRILLVDDDSSSRTILANLLSDIGFEVVEAGGGHAVAKAPERWADIDLVLTDQYMPQGDGWLVLSVFTRVHPDIAVVLISAAAASPPEDLPKEQRFAAEFLKPINHANLLRAIGDLLDLVWTPERRSEASPTDESTAARWDVVPEDGESAAPETAVAAHALLATIAADERNALVRWIELGQITEIREWALLLRTRGDHYQPLVDTLLELLEALDFPALTDFVINADRHPT